MYAQCLYTSALRTHVLKYLYVAGIKKLYTYVRNPIWCAWIVAEYVHLCGYYDVIHIVCAHTLHAFITILHRVCISCRVFAGRKMLGYIARALSWDPLLSLPALDNSCNITCSEWSYMMCVFAFRVYNMAFYELQSR